MSDLYSELLVKKERTAKDRLVKGSIIALIVLLVLAGLFIMPLLLIAAIVLGVCAYLFIFPGTDLEYKSLILQFSFVFFASRHVVLSITHKSFPVNIVPDKTWNIASTQLLFTPFTVTRFAMHRNHAFA